MQSSHTCYVGKHHRGTGSTGANGNRPIQRVPMARADGTQRRGAQKAACAHVRARFQRAPVQTGNTQFRDYQWHGPQQRTTEQPRAKNGGLRRATALRINWHKHWTGDQLLEKVCPEHPRDARPIEAYFGVVNVINNR